METRFQYLRDEKGQPVGCIAIKLVKHENSDDEIHWQLSVLNPVDRFDRKMARHIAFSRLEMKPFVLSVPRDANMVGISTAVMRNIAGADVCSRARKAAKLWLDQFRASHIELHISI